MLRGSPFAAAFWRGLLAGIVVWLIGIVWFYWRVQVSGPNALLAALPLAAVALLVPLVYGAFDQHRCGAGDAQPADVPVCIQARNQHKLPEQVAREFSVIGGPG